MSRREHLFVVAGLIVAAFAPAAGAADWPTWRCDPSRSGSTHERLADRLHRQWVLRLPPQEPAWPDEPRMPFDAAYHPVVVGETMFVASSRNDSVTAVDVRTGQEQWRFYAEGPIRFAPAASGGRLYVVSDDGHLYCLDAATGRLRWKFRGGPSDRRLLGNERLISTWPARGGPVIADEPAAGSGKCVYFTAGIWPFMGVFVYALDADTGQVVWCNDTSGSIYIKQPHNSPAFSGLAPQGYLVVAGEKLLVPNGRAVAAALDRRTGKLLYFHHAANKRSGHCEAAAAGERFLNSGTCFRLDTGKRVIEIGLPSERIVLKTVRSAHHLLDRKTREIVAPLSRLGVVAGTTLYHSTGDHIVAFDTTATADFSYKGFDGKRRKKRCLKVLWMLPTTARPMVVAGGRLYAADDGEVIAIDLPKPPDPADGSDEDANKPAPMAPPPPVAWREKLYETPATMIAAAGRLFVVTEKGSIHCWGAAPAEKPAPARPAATPQAKADSSDPAAELAGRILRATGATEGYCLLLGATDARLAEHLAAQSKLRVIAIDGDAGKAAGLRRRVDAAGLPAGRLAALVADPLEVPLPPYLASLIVAPHAAALGAADKLPVERLFQVLRPYGGQLCVSLAGGDREAFGRRVAAAAIRNAELTDAHGLTLLRRRGPLDGAGSWTGQYGDPGNTCVSPDERVRAPLGLLWFGGVSNKGILPRHGHGPPEQVIGGRLFIEGPDLLRALDVYTGRLLWQVHLPDLGRNYDYTSHEPGANALGTNFVATADSVYVVHGKHCLRLDAASGRVISRLALSAADDPNDLPDWGYLAVWNDLLVAGASPAKYSVPDFERGEFMSVSYRSGRKVRPRLSKKDLAKLCDAVGQWRDFEVAQPAGRVVPPPETQPAAGATTAPADELEFLLANLNRMLRCRDVVAKLPEKVVAEVRKKDGRHAEAVRRDPYYRKEDDEYESLADIEAAIARHLARPAGRADPAGDGPALRRLNRRILERCYSKLPRRGKVEPGRFVLDRTASGEIVVLDRRTGRARWRRRATSAFRHNAVALGGGMLFCIDRLPMSVQHRLLRRGLRPPGDNALLALDANTGRLLWQASRDVFGTWLSYSAAHDVLLQAARPSRDMLTDETNTRMIAYRGRTGKVLWDRVLKKAYAGPCMLHGRTIITQGKALDLLTGEKKMRPHPLTGEEVEWSFKRNYGCNTVIASRHLLTFRSAAAGYYDLAGDGGTGNLGGFKSGCTSNLVVADGVLSAPDYTRTCTCSYQNQSSLALIHMPEVEMWTFQAFDRGKRSVRRVGINFGAPGDRLAEDGTLWLEYPYVGGPTPKVKVEVEPAKGDDQGQEAEPVYFRHHPSRLAGAPLRWVAASGIEGAAAIKVALASSKSPARRWTVRLHFAEPGAARAGERVFDVAIQNKTVLRDLDVAAEANGPRKHLVKTFPGIEFTGSLTVSLTPSDPAKRPGPILCGLEVVRED